MHKKNTAVSYFPIPLPIFFGATACGKTAVAFDLFASGSDSPFAGRVEIVSADSVQIYRDLIIGSARPSETLCTALPHHLIGICNPDIEFSVAEFVSHADQASETIYKTGKLPVMLGGTAFYIKHFMFGLPITPPADNDVRLSLQKRCQNEGAAVLLAELKTFDPVSAAKIHVNDAYRIIRAHEVYAASGKPLSSFSLPESYRSGYQFLPIFLNRPRQDLYRRIELRVDEMFESGLIQEFKQLYEKGYRFDSPAMQAIGYREFFTVSPDNPPEAPYQTVAELIKRNSKRYAKRQQTFFQRLPHIHTIELDKSDAKDNLLTILHDFYKNIQ